jgi:hypothetical protein
VGCEYLQHRLQMMLPQRSQSADFLKVMYDTAKLGYCGGPIIRYLACEFLGIDPETRIFGEVTLEPWQIT